MKTATIWMMLATGSWLEVKQVDYLSDQILYHRMREVQQANGGKRVKATDQRGALIDILP